jgi:hypothetical protein
VRGLAEFVRLFGNRPYQYKSQQLVNGQVYADRNDMERGFIYAYELAKIGHPIVFERITNEGLAGSSLDVTLTPTNFTATVNANQNVVISRPMTPDITFDTDEVTVTQVEYTAELDGSTLASMADDMFGVAVDSLTFSVSGGIQYVVDGSGNLGLATGFVDAGFISGTFDGETFTLVRTGTLGSNMLTIGWTTNGGITTFQMTAAFGQDVALNISTDGGMSFSPSPNNYGLSFVGNIFRMTTPNQNIAVAGIPTQGSPIGGFTIHAKYSGAYGAGIVITIGMPNSIGLQEITATFMGRTERFVVSLIRGESNFVGNIVGDIITIDASNIPMGDAEYLSITPNPGTPLNFEGDPMGEESTAEGIYARLAGADGFNTIPDGFGYTDGTGFWGRFKDRELNDYAIFTTGAYPLFSDDSNDVDLTTEQLRTVADFGLGFTLVDAKEGVQVENLQAHLQSIATGRNSQNTPLGAYGAMFYKSRLYRVSSELGVSRVRMPGSFGYCLKLAQNVTGGRMNSWLATAGTGSNADGRGVLTGQIVDNDRMGGALSDRLQDEFSVRVNPIQFIRGVGDTIMGNATMLLSRGGMVNYSFLNIRVLTTLIKRFFYKLGNAVLFEQNDLTAFLEIKTEGARFMDTLLDRGLATVNAQGQTIEPYRITRIPTQERAKMNIEVKFFPLDAIEYVDIGAILQDSYVSVTE